MIKEPLLEACEFCEIIFRFKPCHIGMAPDCACRGARRIEQDCVEGASPPEARIGDNNIEALVRRLRQKLAEAGAPPDTVVTVKKRGYRLAGVIEAGVMGPTTAGR